MTLLKTPKEWDENSVDPTPSELPNEDPPQAIPDPAIHAQDPFL